MIITNRIVNINNVIGFPLSFCFYSSFFSLSFASCLAIEALLRFRFLQSNKIFIVVATSGILEASCLMSCS